VTVVAAFYDVHGNLPALEAVLADPAFARAEAVVIGGDVASGPMPAEVLDRLTGLDLPVRWVRGNADREVVDFFDRGDTDPSVHPPDDPAARSDAFTAGRIAPGHRDLLAGFEEVVRLDGALYCHGSPRRDDEIITAVTPAQRLEPMLAGVDEALVVCGHTHHQFDLRAGARRVVNAGSVGMPYEGRAGAFWLLVAGGEPEPRRTDYDVPAAIAAMTATGYPDFEELIRESLVEPVTADAVAQHFESAATSD
jgi:predicted phosphodiesterase